MHERLESEMSRHDDVIVIGGGATGEHAAGAEPIVPPIRGLGELEGMWTSRAALDSEIATAQAVAEVAS